MTPTSVATVLKGVTMPSKEWLDATSRAPTPVGVAMTPTARKVANTEERKILDCILNKKEVGDGSDLKWMSKLLIDCRRSW